MINAPDSENFSIEKIDHAYTKKYIQNSGLTYIFLKNFQYVEAMSTNYFIYTKSGGVLTNSQRDGNIMLCLKRWGFLEQQKVSLKRF